MTAELRDDIRRVLVRPVISEKSYQLVAAHNQYTFRVLDSRTRPWSVRPSRSCST